MAYDDDYIPPIQFTPAGATEDEQEETLAVVTPSPGFPTTAQLLAESIQKEAFTTVLDFTPQQVTVRFQIDGLWHTGSSMDRETGDFMLATLKKIAGLNYRERRARQEGRFGTLYQKTKQKVRVVSQGIKTGERVAIYLDWKRKIPEKVAELGMRDGMIKQLSSFLEDPNTGIVLVTAIPGEGYTTAWRGVLDACDRLTRDYFVIEEKSEGEQEVINVYPIEFDRDKGENALTPVPQLLLKQPDVLAFNELPDAKTIDGIVDLSTTKNMPVFVRAPGKNALDAILRLVALKPDVEKLVNRLTAVVSMRLMRKLCDRCKVAYTPHPSLLQKLGIPKGRIAELYKPFVHQPGMVDEKEKEIEPCRECHGIGYKGRLGLFELLQMNDTLRSAITQRAKLSQLSAVAQRSGHVSMQQEGIVQVARGITSLEELQRVLKA